MELDTDVGGKIIYKPPFGYVTQGGPLSGIAPGLFTGIKPKSPSNIVVLANVPGFTNPIGVLGFSAAFLESTEGCADMNNTWAGCTTTGGQSAINVPLRCQIKLEAFRNIEDVDPIATQTFNFEPKPASISFAPILDPITKRLDVMSKPQQLVLNKLPPAKRFRLSGQVLGKVEDAIPLKLGDDIVKELIDSVWEGWNCYSVR